MSTLATATTVRAQASPPAGPPGAGRPGPPSLSGHHRPTDLKRDTGCTVCEPRAIFVRFCWG